MTLALDAGPRVSTGARRLSVIEIVALGVIVLALFAALVGPEALGTDPLAQNLRARNRPPSMQFLLGTDHLGRDIAARLITGLRMSVLVAALALLVALASGAILGLVTSAIGGPVAAIFQWLVDVLRAMPGVLLALVLVAGLGQGLGPVALAVGLTFAPTFALVAAMSYRRERASPAVMAVWALGAGRLRIAFRHVLPNLIGPLVTLSAIIFPRCIVTESVMSFLGLGATPDTATWGRMIAQASRFLEVNPVAVIAPTLALALLTLALTIAGSRMRTHLDPLRDGRR